MATLRLLRLVSLLLLSVTLGPLQGTSASHHDGSIGVGQEPVADKQATFRQLWDLLGQTVGESIVRAVADHCHNHLRQHQEDQQHQPSDADNVTVQPSCQAQPEPLPETFSQDVSFDQKDRACVRSCLQLRDQGGAPRDGIYWFTGMPVPVLCDFSHDGGGWTLLLTANSKSWDLLSVKSRREGAPTMADDYSILRHADAIRDLGNGTRFAYRIEAQAETGRQRWGGVWLAPRHYSFVDETGGQTDVRLVRRFDSWYYKDAGLHSRMPWLRGSDYRENAVLSTSKRSSRNWHGTLASHVNAPENYRPSPWIDDLAPHSGRVLYWMREEEL
ncbi:hypothetical protein FJT64_020339 [Amphibalanus amphitrite]|uniref:Fibrinogen C-terminal domain-containing protein n=1 Tax=Amphibalanus amphitrite TaxID=1232801 RepID=A0A6A4X234_AMPAM|nr:hypothetical protein FJT64_020339 [Amphibalanus amphitrite]